MASSQREPLSARGVYLAGRCYSAGGRQNSMFIILPADPPAKHPVSYSAGGVRQKKQMSILPAAGKIACSLFCRRTRGQNTLFVISRRTRRQNKQTFNLSPREIASRTSSMLLILLSSLCVCVCVHKLLQDRWADLLHNR